MQKPMEAVVALARCQKNKAKLFGIQFQHRDPRYWSIHWAFPISASRAKGEGYTETSVKGGLVFDEGYCGCPNCGAMSMVFCGTCGKISCRENDVDAFTCAWCGKQGISRTVESFDFKAGGNM